MPDTLTQRQDLKPKKFPGANARLRKWHKCVAAFFKVLLTKMSFTLINQAWRNPDISPVSQHCISSTLIVCLTHTLRGVTAFQASQQLRSKAVEGGVDPELIASLLMQ